MVLGSSPIEISARVGFMASWPTDHTISQNLVERISFDARLRLKKNYLYTEVFGPHAEVPSTYGQFMNGMVAWILCDSGLCVVKEAETTEGRQKSGIQPGSDAWLIGWPEPGVFQGQLIYLIE